MKKRLFCLFLCLVMLLSVVLTSCSSKTDEEAESDIQEEASESAMTLTMWIVSENKVNKATADLVNEALNTITKSKFKTQLIVKYFTEDEYLEELTKAITAFEASMENAGKEDETEAETGEADENPEVTDVTVLDEDGISIIKYPEALANQVDIIYIGNVGETSGEEMYLEFLAKDWLDSVDDELSSTSKKLQEYISTTLLEAVQQEGKTYAIPNNRTIGTYTYMLLDKELMDAYKLNACISTGKIDGLHNDYVYSYLELVSKLHPEYVPIDSTYDDCLDMLAYYWSIDPETYELLDDFSVFGYHYTDIAELNRGSVALGFNSLFEDAAFTAQYLKLNKFKFDGYFKSDADGDKPAALRFVSDADYTMLGEAEKKGYCEYDGKQYYVVPVVYPRADSNDIYGHMFGVCKYSLSTSRSMEIITYLNTNSEFRNILQYGVLNTHYKLEQDDQTKVTTLTRQNNDYMMDIYATGNAFIAYPEPQMSVDIWESGKIQNRVSQVDPLLGFNIADYATEEKAEEEESFSIGKLGYTVSYETGFSKDIFKQNATLKTWLEQCDAAGDGIYALPTTKVDGTNLAVNYYVYNNALTNAVDFSVEVFQEFETQVDDSGNETEVQTDLDFIMTYTDTADSSVTGYELSIVTLYIKKSTAYEITGSQNGFDANVRLASEKDYVKLDFMNTQQYSIEIYDALSKSAISGNSALLAWVNACDAAYKNAALPTGTAQTYVTKVETADGNTVLVLYRTGLINRTDITIRPNGESGKLTLAVNFEDVLDEEGLPAMLELTPPSSMTDDEKEAFVPEANYYLYYFIVTEHEDIEVSLVSSNNGVVDTNASYETSTVDFDFELIGNLDTELIKFMYELNQKLVGILNSCQTYEELEAKVSDFKGLLSTAKTPILYVDIKDSEMLTYAAELETKFGSLAEFHQKILSITSSTQVKNITTYYTDTNNTKEEHVYYDTPYMLYQAWMKEFGYLPEDSVPGNSVPDDTVSEETTETE